jgi:hypothetical protein
VRLAALQPPSLPETAAALRYVTGSPSPGLLRRLRSTPPVQRPVRLSPTSARFEPVTNLKDVITPVPHVLLFASPAGPAPSGSTGTPGFVRAASHPPRHHPGQAALSFNYLLRQVEDGGLSPPHETTAPHGALTQLVTQPSLQAQCWAVRERASGHAFVHLACCACRHGTHARL